MPPSHCAVVDKPEMAVGTGCSIDFKDTRVRHIQNNGEFGCRIPVMNQGIAMWYVDGDGAIGEGDASPFNPGYQLYKPPPSVRSELANIEFRHQIVHVQDHFSSATFRHQCRK